MRNSFRFSPELKSGIKRGLALLLLVFSSLSPLLQNPIVQVWDTTAYNSESLDRPYFHPYEFLIPPIPDQEIERNIQNATKVPNNSSASPLHNCSATNQVRLEINSTGHWLLHSLHNGKPKNMGGDDFYVTYEDYDDPNYDRPRVSPSAVANITHLGGGTYHLDFVEPPMRFAMLPENQQRPYDASGKGRVTVHFVYTCFIGQWEFASKRSWWSNGASRVVHTQHNVTFPMHFRSFPLSPSLLGQQQQQQQQQQHEEGINLGKYDHVICYGDSVMRGFCGTARDKCPEDYHKANVISLPNHRMKIGNKTLSRHLQTLEKHFQQDTRLENVTKNNAMILSSSAWDLLLPEEPTVHPDLEDHITSLRTLLTTLRQNHPNLTLYWKAPQTLDAVVLQKECYEKLACLDRGLYMSNHYVRDLHERQSKLMEEFDIPIIDVFELSLFSPEWHLNGDGVHFQTKFNHALFNLLYPLDYPENTSIECQKAKENSG